MLFLRNGFDELLFRPSVQAGSVDTGEIAHGRPPRGPGNPSPRAESGHDRRCNDRGLRHRYRGSPPPEIDDRGLRNMFRFVFVLNLALFAVMCLTAPVIAGVSREGRLVAVVRVFSALRQSDSNR
jgi:hypothetical protein